jgi:hypothetical protein
MLCKLNSESICVVQIATNGSGYHVHAGALLNYYTPDRNQATPTHYYMSDYIFMFDNLPSWGLVIGLCILTWSECTFPQSIQ